MKLFKTVSLQPTFVVEMKIIKLQMVNHPRNFLIFQEKNEHRMSEIRETLNTDTNIVKAIHMR